MRKLFTNIILLAVTVTALGQQSIGVKVNGGISFFRSENQTYPSWPMKLSYYPMPSGQVGLTYQYRLKKKITLGAELLYTQIEGKEIETIFTGLAIGNTFTSDGYVETKKYRHIYYLGMPVYVGYKLNKLTVNLGVQTNFKVGGGSHFYYHDVHDNEEPINKDVKQNSIDVNKIDYGLRLGLFYKLTDKFSLETNYYYGLTNISENASIDLSRRWHIHQFTVGVRYNLLTLK